MTVHAAHAETSSSESWLQAIKASGVLVRLEPEAFLTLLDRLDDPLVVYSPCGFLRPHHYLTSYRGLAFFTKAKQPLYLPRKTQIIRAKRIWIPY